MAIKPQVWTWAAIVYVWGALTWCCGWMAATAILATPPAAIFVWGFIGAMLRRIDTAPPPSGPEGGF